MLLGLSLLFLLGFLCSAFAAKLRLPHLLGMIVAGAILGPSLFDLLPQELLALSPTLRQIALVIILTRAGLGRDAKDLKKAGWPALFLSFVPASFEILGYILLGKVLLGLPFLTAAVLGCVISAVSPAIIVPGMLSMIENKIGTKRQIPQMILAGSAVDDIFVLTLFSIFTSMAASQGFSATKLFSLPISMGLGIALGILLGLIVHSLFRKFPQDTDILVVLVLSIAFLLVEGEKLSPLPYASLLALFFMGITLRQKNPQLEETLSPKLKSLWTGWQILLFTLLGAALDLTYLLKNGFLPLCLIAGALFFRFFGVWLSLLGTPLTKKEKLFAAVAYLPKATVQAAIGATPLAMGLPYGELILTTALLSILITAPLGAMGIDALQEKLLS